MLNGGPYAWNILEFNSFIDKSSRGGTQINISIKRTYESDDQFYFSLLEQIVPLKGKFSVFPSLIRASSTWISFSADFIIRVDTLNMCPNYIRNDLIID